MPLLSRLSGIFPFLLSTTTKGLTNKTFFFGANNQSSLILSCSSSQELFTWLLAVNVDNHKDSSEIGPDGGVRALWSWTIRSHSTSPAPISSHHHHHGVKDGLDEVKGKLTSRFEVLKDEVQSVFPIIKVIFWRVSLTFLFPENAS